MTKIPQKLRKKMDQLLDDMFIKEFLEKNLKGFFVGAEKIKSIKRKTHKEYRGKEDYTLIIEFVLKIVYKNKKVLTKSVFCKTHSDERKNKSIYYMETLYRNGFNKGSYKVPRPLIYLPELKTGFYEGVTGSNLLYYLNHSTNKKIIAVVKDAAHWISTLHNLNPNNFKNAKLVVKTIKDNSPPIKQVFSDMKRDHRELYDQFAPLYKATVKYEKKFLKELKNTGGKKIIYADYHPENIIIPFSSKKGVTVIDFTDISLGDPYKDVGAFLEQIRAMYVNGKKTNVQIWQKVFLEEYAKANKLKLGASDWQRINLYCLWTALRSSIYFFYKSDHRSSRLMMTAQNYLDMLESRHNWFNK